MIYCSSINCNTIKHKLRTTSSFSFTIINTCPNDKDITGHYIISPKNVDWMLRELLYLRYFTTSFGSSSKWANMRVHTRHAVLLNKVYFFNRL